MIKKEVLPAAREFENQCKNTWEEMLGSFAGNTKLTTVGTVLWTGFFGASWSDLLAAGGIAVATIVKTFVDYGIKFRKLKRHNALSYLMHLRRM